MFILTLWIIYKPTIISSCIQLAHLNSIYPTFDLYSRW